MEINRFYNYAVRILRPQNTEIFELELKNVADKTQDNSELVLHNTIINEICNQISDMIQCFSPLFRYS